MRLREKVALWGYVGLTNVLLPIGILLALPFLLLKEKRRKTVFQRLGFQRLPVIDDANRPLWIHALSLGETLSCLKLITELRQKLPEQKIVFSVSTLSAMEIARERLAGVVDGLFYFPLDLWWPTARILKKLKPAAVVIVETDIWPGFQFQLRRNRIPSLLVNARLSPSAYRSSMKFRSIFQPALNTFNRVFPQSETEASRYLEVGMERARLGQNGNLKFDVANTAPELKALEELKLKLGLKNGERVLIAGSTHPGEEQTVLSAYRQVRDKCDGVRLIIVPRHPVRALEVKTLCVQAGWKADTFSTLNAAIAWEVVVVDVMGILSMLYQLAIASFIGGSLVSKGGQNPIEAAAAGCPVTFGADMSDFPDISKWMLEAKAAIRINSREELAAAWISIISNPDQQRVMSDRGLQVVSENCGVTSVIADEIVSTLNN